MVKDGRRGEVLRISDDILARRSREDIPIGENLLFSLRSDELYEKLHFILIVFKIAGQILL